MDGGINTLGLHSICLEFTLLCMPAVSAFHKNTLFAFGKHNEIQVGIVIMRSIVNKQWDTRTYIFFIYVLVMKVLLFCN